MGHVNVSDFRQNLAAHLDDVTESQAPLFVTRGKGKGVVVIAESEYESMAETLHLLSSPKNAARLRKSIADLDSGKGNAHGLVDPKR
jgi:antitoxin YefM